MSVAGEPYDTTRVLTLPNVLSFLRLLGVPLFLWLLLVRENDIWAVVVLAVGGASDWFDGYLARKWNQRSRLGQILDPAADRLYILATLIGFVARDIVPLWLLIVLVTRDVLLALMLPALRSRGFISLPVHFLGKAATFLLLYAFPLVLLGAGEEPWQLTFRVLGWALVIWGAILYWSAGALYLRQCVDVVRNFPPQPRIAAGSTS
ncbi:MAG: CDP-alcohol phosphatidyltransferase family protein [Propionibacteriaceae bacterium]|nr:CDP-alcohol phosphatidyltransferase family protein [Propionibacteriaceae bacterium]